MERENYELLQSYETETQFDEHQTLSTTTSSVNYDFEDIGLDELSHDDERSVSKQEEIDKVCRLLLSRQIQFDLPDKSIDRELLESNYLYGTSFPSSFQTLMKMSSFDFTPKAYKCFIISCCGEVLQSDLNTKLSSNHVCICENQHTLGNLEKKEDYFIQSDLRSLFSFALNQLMDHITFDLTSTRTAKYPMKDVTYGSEYHRIKSFKETNNQSVDVITLLLGIDSIPYSKSGSKSLTPVVATIAELSHDLRRRHPFLLAIHAGKSKPDSNLFMKPTIDQLLAIESDPIQLQDRQVILRILSVAADAPARSWLLRSDQFNSIHGCHKCMSESVQVKLRSKSGKTLKQRKFDLSREFILRSHEKWVAAADKASECGKSINGVKSRSEFLRLPYVNIVKLFPVDFMHAVFLGVVRLILKIFLDYKTKHLNPKVPHLSPHSRRQLRQYFNPNVKSCFLRSPRNLDYLSVMKSVELENYLYYYFATVMQQLLPGNYYSHFMLLTFAISRLQRKILSVSQLHRARQSIKEFVKQFAKLYPKNYHNYNVHALLHLASDVSDFGPLLFQSCYVTEGILFELKKMIKGSNRIAQEVYRKATREAIFILHLRNVYLHIDSNQKLFFSQILALRSKDIKIIGAVRETSLSQEFIIFLSNEKIITTGEIKKIIVRDIHVETGEVNSYFKDKLGRFIKVIKILMTEDRSVVIIAREIVSLKSLCVLESKESFVVNHIQVCPLNNIKFRSILLLYPRDLITPCFSMKNTNNFFLFEIINYHY